MRYCLVSLVLAAFLSTGCTTARQPVLHDFGLPTFASADAAVNSVASPQGAGTVTVDAPTWLWDNRIRFRVLYAGPTLVKFYGLDQWIAPPPELFEQMLTSSIKPLNYSVQVQLLEFEQQFDAADQARVVLRLSVDAYEVGSKLKIATQEFRLEQRTQTPDAAGAVSGFTDLAKQAAGRIQRWLAELPNR